jgi:hypothetical protein
VGAIDLPFSTPIQTGPETHPASSTVGNWVVLGVKGPEYGVDHPPHLTPKLRMIKALPLLSVCAFMACYGVTFTSNSTLHVEYSLQVPFILSYILPFLTQPAALQYSNRNFCIHLSTLTFMLHALSSSSHYALPQFTVFFNAAVVSFSKCVFM